MMGAGSTGLGELGNEAFDVLVVGGGVQGLTMAIEAGRAGRRVLLVERGRVGGATSGAWFRILHGGLRYLQTLDLSRLARSLAERRWFLRTFPDLVRLQPFLAPLYGRGLKRPETFRIAFGLEALLAGRRDPERPGDVRIPPGRILDPSAVASLYPEAPREGLRGGALWSEAIAPDAAALMAALAAEARRGGAVLIEETEATALVTERGRAQGVVLRDARNGRERHARAKTVVNAAGPWSAGVAERFDRPRPELFRPTLGFNLLLDRPPPAQAGLALTPSGGGPMVFLYPLEGRTFAGTWYAPWRDGPEDPRPEEPAIAAFLEALNAAAPGLAARRRDVLQVHAGLLPARAEGSARPSARDVVVDHGAAGGPAGLFSVSGVKFTTARRLAEDVVRRAAAISGEGDG